MSAPDAAEMNLYDAEQLGQRLLEIMGHVVANDALKRGATTVWKLEIGEQVFQIEIGVAPDRGPSETVQ